MKKIFMYDTFGTALFCCGFEGLDEDGKPRLTILTPGCPVQNFHEYTETFREDPQAYYFLCEEGKSAD